MATSIYLPAELLKAVDRRARLLKTSRNRFITDTLIEALKRDTDWSAGFFEELKQVSPENATAVDDLLETVRSRRSSKRAPSL